MRTTEVMGTVRPCTLRHTMRERMNCRTRSDGGTFAQQALDEHGLRAVVHARGDEADGIGGDDLAVGVERAGPAARGAAAAMRSSGTWMYASSAWPSSMVVIIVEFVTRSPTRTAMSPTVPACGATTR